MSLAVWHSLDLAFLRDSCGVMEPESFQNKLEELAIHEVGTRDNSLIRILAMMVLFKRHRFRKAQFTLLLIRILLGPG